MSTLWRIASGFREVFFILCGFFLGTLWSWNHASETKSLTRGFEVPTHDRIDKSLSQTSMNPGIDGSPPLITQRQPPHPRPGEGTPLPLRIATRMQSNKTLESYLLVREEQPEKVEAILDVLNLQAGSVIADVGAGSGFFTWLFSREVGKQGKVFAVDIDPGAIEYLRRRRESSPPPFDNITIIQSRLDDVLLPPHSLDWAFLCEAHFYVHPSHESMACLKSIHTALKPGGRIAIIESVDQMGQGELSREELESAFKRVGFQPVAYYDFLDKPPLIEHFSIMEKKRP